MDELVKKKEVELVTFLDADRSIIKRTSRGYIKAINHRVKLSEKQGHIWELKGDHMLTAEGYEKVNKFVGIKQVKEDKIVLNGEEFTNPYIKYDKYGRKVAGLQKCTLAGYDTTGKLQLSSVLITYNSVEEFTARVMKNAMYDNKFAKLMPRPLWEVNRKDMPTFAPYDIDDVMVLVVDTSKPAFMKLYQELEEKRGNLEKKLQTVARRNAFRKHPATGGIYKVKTFTELDKNSKPIDTVAYVNVVQWVDINEEAEKVQIQEWLESNDYEVDKYHEQDPADNDEDYVPEGDDSIDEIIDEVVIDEVTEKEDKEELANLVAWIEKGIKRTKYKAPGNWKELSIMELETIRQSIIDMEDKI